ncbi:hypothetical protein PAHAL_6G160700 [Panicum hallii]|uniref:Uncharacterized protein n=1 Tax=Panicum hallii TaxID=206008 RepID=A0A2S3I1V4_9POAL|nr:uncharacterized protein LOC112897116 [Panicum hallii]PAN34649.1 hypothetical protein PAHAL_6G160700 [Panicum hallii]
MEDQQDPSPGDPHAIVVDIPSLSRALELELAVRRQHRGSGSQSCTLNIGKVYDLTRNVDEHEYDPHYVSIGPYHRKRIPNIIREDDKLASLNNVLSQASPGTTVQKYLTELAPVEGRARSFYAHWFSNMSSKEFLRMLLLDACFVIDRFGDMTTENISSPGANGSAQSSPAPAAGDGSPIANGHGQDGHQDRSTASASGGGNKLETGWMVRDVLYLAENQIPYFVIDKIHNLTFSGGRAPVVKAIAGCISCILQKQQYSMGTVEDDAPPPGNLLHLLYRHFLKPDTVSSSSSRTDEPVSRCRTAMEYHINGVNLKSCLVGGIGGTRSILEVMLDRASGTLVVPRLNIDGDTWRILRNLMALEQQNPAVGSHVTAYCIFMSQLACTAADVEFLSRRGVIDHRLGNHGEVAACFSDLCKGIVFDADDPGFNYLRGTCQELDELYRSRRRRWMALLRHKYSANPWLVVGVMAAALGLLCAIVQSIYAVLSYNHGAAK